MNDVVAAATTRYGLPLWVLLLVGVVISAVLFPAVVWPSWKKGRAGPLSPAHGDRVTTSNWLACTSLMMAGSVIVFDDFGWLARSVAKPLLLVFGGAFVIFSVLTGLVLMFNRPQFIIPPHHRGKPGLWQEWRAKRRGGPGSSAS